MKSLSKVGSTGFCKRLSKVDRSRGIQAELASELFDVDERDRAGEDVDGGDGELSEAVELESDGTLEKVEVDDILRGVS